MLAKLDEVLTKVTYIEEKIGTEKALIQTQAEKAEQIPRKIMKIPQTIRLGVSDL